MGRQEKEREREREKEGGRKGTRDKGDFEQLLLNVAALINHRSEDSNGIFLRSLSLFLERERERERERGPWAI